MTRSPGSVTIAIPTRNRIDGLIKALTSAVGQTYTDLEIIVSDNNSGGDVKGALSAFKDGRIKSFRHDRDLSMTENWNFCLKQAAGDYFLLLSDDDQLVPEAVETLVRAFLPGKTALSYGRAVFRDEAGGPLGLSRGAPPLESGEEFIKASLAGRRNALPSGTLFRTEAARLLGGYPETGNSTDLALRLALATQGAAAYSLKPVVEYSIHPGGLSFDTAKTKESFLRLAAWAGLPSSPLNKWHNKVESYCAGSLRARARACSLRGDSKGARLLLSASNLVSSESLLENILVEVFSWTPVRYLAALSRMIQKNIRGSFPGRKL